MNAATALLFAVVGVVAVLAYANGANDVSKAVATLVGSGVTGYRRAIVWGAAWTAVGGLLAGVLGGAMLSTFARSFLLRETVPTVS